MVSAPGLQSWFPCHQNQETRMLRCQRLPQHYHLLVWIGVTQRCCPLFFAHQLITEECSAGILPEMLAAFVRSLGVQLFYLLRSFQYIERAFPIPYQGHETMRLTKSDRSSIPTTLTPADEYGLYRKQMPGLQSQPRIGPPPAA